MGPSGRFTHVFGFGCCWDRLYTGYVLRVELPVQRRLCPIFVRDVGSPDIHECFRGLTGSQRTPGIWGVTKSMGGNDAVWVIVDRFKKLAHLLPIQTIFTLDKLASLYVKEIVKLHGVPVSIVSDRDTRFTSKFSKSLQNSLGTQLNFSTAFHPHKDGQSECKTRENSNFLKNGKMVISVKIRNFSRSRMTKRTSPLESSREI